MQGVYGLGRAGDPAVPDIKKYESVARNLASVGAFSWIKQTNPLRWTPCCVTINVRPQDQVDVMSSATFPALFSPPEY